MLFRSRTDQLLQQPLLHKGSQMAERLGNRATNQKVAGSIPRLTGNRDVET